MSEGPAVSDHGVVWHLGEFFTGINKLLVSRPQVRNVCVFVCVCVGVVVSVSL